MVELPLDGAGDYLEGSRSASPAKYSSNLEVDIVVCQQHGKEAYIFWSQ